MMPDALASLHAFGVALYACFTRRAAALFDLIDALLCVESVPAPVHLSATPTYRRRWGSFYAALAKGRLDVTALRALVAQHPLPDQRPIYAVDVSVWPRCDAETSPARGFYDHPSRHAAGQPIVAGWAYQWVAQLGFARDSWTAPLDVARVPPTEDGHAVAARQIRALVSGLAPGHGRPLCVFDAGYDPEELARERGDAPVSVLVRLRAGRCFYGDPPPPKATGRPPRHGAKFACDDPATWPEPTATHTVQDDQYGRCRTRVKAGPVWNKVEARIIGGREEEKPHGLCHRHLDGGHLCKYPTYMARWPSLVTLRRCAHGLPRDIHTRLPLRRSRVAGVHRVGRRPRRFDHGVALLTGGCSCPAPGRCYPGASDRRHPRRVVRLRRLSPLLAALLQPARRPQRRLPGAGACPLRPLDRRYLRCQL